MFRFFILICMVFSSLLLSKEYKLILVVDESSKTYKEAIKKEALKLFSSEDVLNFQIKVCSNNCDSLLENTNAVFLLNSISSKTKTKNSYLITYNLISSIYDENRVIRTTALAIFEYLKENKRKSIHIKNKALVLDAKEKKSLKTLDLKEVLQLAIDNNLQIKRNQNRIKLQEIGVHETKSLYKPKIDIFSNYIEIDEDRALASRGLNPQRSLEAGVKLSQLIYSNKVLKNIEINKLLYKSTKQEAKALDDEILYKATLIYLNIIKAKEYNQIIKIKHDFIQRNLLFAKQRVEIGVQDRSDVYRWQSELANANIQLATSTKELKKLKVELSNLLRVKNEYDFFEYTLNSKLFKLLNKDAIKYLEDKRVQEAFTKQIVHTHSRLRQIKELISAKNEQLQMNKDSYFLPSIAFEGSAKKVVKRGGEASDLPRTWDEEEYQAVINLNLPLYEGGLKKSKIQKNEVELIDLKLQYNDIKNLIIENVRKNYESLSQSYSKIAYSKDSLNSSKKNFELIQDKYKKGKENIISLLDAQNSYIVSKLNLNISNIEYLVDLSSIYFFSGRIDILLDEIKKEEVERKIQEIIKDKN
ncbi:TolC family protein [Arcobacter sp. YIC-464]|uniref:TolC family protein n=1 Tax=Arcobacter sp. YIC-464 TaxID=3376631 RepID=UPI003C1D9967